jgi:hypothetical protein
VRYTAGEESTEELDAMRAEVREAAKRPYVYDPDCPLLTEEQLREFRPVHFATEAERLAAMRRMGIVPPPSFSKDYAASQDEQLLDLIENEPS